jgi:type I restriction enzyme M protein
MTDFRKLADLIWKVADNLRGRYKQSEYGRVILPLPVLRRLDCVLEPTKAKVLAKLDKLPPKVDDAMRDRLLCQAAGPGMQFYNTSKFTFTSLLKGETTSTGVADNLRSYINGFPASVRDVFVEKFEFDKHIDRLGKANLLYAVLGRFCDPAIDLHPDRVDNVTMGYVFEELIRRFAELSNETAGEHFTPREVIRLMVNVLFLEEDEETDDDIHHKPVIRTLYDPACGTGGMLAVAEKHLREMNVQAKLVLFGQELNPESFAICQSDMLITGHDPTNIKYGNSFTEDGHDGRQFDYFLSNPPFGVEWSAIAKDIRQEHEKLGMAGRFGAGLPRVSDGSLLFLQHMLSKFKPFVPGDPEKTGSRLAIVFNGSPLFTGAAGSGESEVRRWLIENDLLEAVIGLPLNLFYNTGIGTYIWVVSNRKPRRRRGKVQLIDAGHCSVKMRKSLGEKRNKLGEGENGEPDHVGEITRLYGSFRAAKHCQILKNSDFGYRRVTVERPLRLNFAVTVERLARAGELLDGTLGLQEALQSPALEGLFKDREAFVGRLRMALHQAGATLKAPQLKALLSALAERDPTAEVCKDAKGNVEPDPDLRDYENVPLDGEVEAYIAREVLPHVPDAWVDESKTKVGYEIPFTRLFYEPEPLPPVEELEADILAIEGEIQKLLRGVMS